MPDWLLTAAAIVLAVYVALVLALLALGRRGDARALARFVPDCVVLFKRLLGDSRISRRRKLLIGALVGYLLLPIDLIPDFIPVAGQLDDAIVVALVLRAILRDAGPEIVREHWPGPPESLAALLYAAGAGSGPRD
jgi:uncharacterized membrane protein YkvA (DUF1232 family)